MSKKIIYTIISLVLAVIIFLFGYLTGVVVKTRVFSNFQKTIDLLSSGTKSNLSIIIRGKFKKTEGKDIIISFNGKDVKIPLIKNTNVIFLKKGAPSKKIKLSDLKAGDSISVYLALKKNGLLEGGFILKTEK